MQASAAAHRFAVATALAAFVLILIGGLVHGTGSSLACPDWPLCHGSLLPEMRGGVAVEHSHRLAAAAVVVLTIALALLLARRRRQDPLPAKVGGLAVALVVVQAGLGGLTVLLRLPTPVSTLHTAVSLLFFMTVLWLAARTAPAPDRPSLDARATRLALAAAVAVYFQMVLGGLVRHSGAALACTDLFEGAVRSFPLCRGALWPADAHPTVLVHALHRLGAVAVALLVLAASAVVTRASARRPALRRLALLAALLVLAQAILGILSVATFLELWTVEAHLGVATALLGVLLLIALRGRPAPSPPSSSGDPSGHPRLLAGIADVIRLAKPRITGLVLATFAGGMWLAPRPPGGLPTWKVIAASLGTALIVAASNALNMFLERDVDGLMERTRDRPLPRGRLSPETALVTGTSCACVALPLLLLGGNGLTGLLAAIALAVYVGVYTPLKLRSPAALFVGAVPGAIPPLMGWTAATGRIEAPGLVLGAILFLWQIPHFLAIAIYRSDDYRRAGFKVLAQHRNPFLVRAVIVAFSSALALSTALLGSLKVAGPPYLAISAALGVAFVAWAAVGFRRLGEAARAWARSLFFASIVYLTLLFAALVAGRTVT